MAKVSSPWVGRSHGKMGEGVYYHGFNKQLARARVRDPKNPKTVAQAAQRLNMRNVGKLARQLSGIIDHSWEGLPAWESRSRFISNALKLAAPSIETAITTSQSYAPVVNANAAGGVHIPNMLVASGSLPLTIPYSFASGNILLPEALHFDTQLTGAAARDAFVKAFGGQHGAQQVTLIVGFAAQDALGYVVDEWRVVRINFNQEHTGGLFTPGTLGDKTQLSSSAIDESRSTGWGDLEFLVSDNHITAWSFRSIPSRYACAAYIISEYNQATGKWLRSVSPISSFGEGDDFWNDIDPIMAEYLGVSTEALSSLYLNKAPNSLL